MNLPDSPVPIPVPTGIFDREPEGLEVLMSESVPLPDWAGPFPPAGAPPEWQLADKVRRVLMDTDAYRALIRERELLP